MGQHLRQFACLQVDGNHRKKFEADEFVLRFEFAALPEHAAIVES